jgi:Zn-dependent peptidase ImmA (M78 family)
VGRASKAGVTKARRLRERFGLGLERPVPDLLALAERDLGVPVVIPERLPGELAGAYLPRDGEPVIFVSGADPAARMRFTLAHELAHHAFGDSQQADTHAGLVSPGHWIEVRANAFAAELLMPGPGVTRFTEPTVETVVALAGTFGASLLASAIRLETAGLATPAQVAALKAGLETVAAPAYEDSISAAKRALPRWPNPNSPLARGLPAKLGQVPAA